MEMGAEYQTDWNPECTLLICAFNNTPKFRQVVADCGTIVSKVVTADQETTPLNKPQKPVKKDIKQKPSIVASSEVASYLPLHFYSL
ncbi:hypothetical protein Syun_011248 [Stephania yunnanensis]|uniref:Uncharacterized protein n=1 Tax=Stephania yunnanensis TaxID=152371 RepID=A0AAP0PE88_9MAGN